MNTKELRAKASELLVQVRNVLTTDDGKNTAEIQAKADELLAEADALETRAKRLEGLEEREAFYNSAATAAPVENRSLDTASVTDAKRDEALRSYLLRGEDGLSAEHRSIMVQMRDQNVATGSAGGYLVPTTLEASVISALKYYGPMNSGVVTQLTTASGNPINMPYNDDTAQVGSLIAEGGTISTSASLTFSQKSLGAYKFTSNTILVSSELLQDSAIDIGAFVSDKIAERLGRVLNTYHTTGTGSAQPEGLAFAASQGAVTLSNTAVAADDLLDLVHSVDIAYRGQGAFMMNDATFKAVRKLKDSTGQYLWQPSIQAGVPSKLFGYDVYINNDMAGVTAGAKAVLFGDFKKFTVRKVKGITVKRLNELYAANDQVGFMALARYDSKLLDGLAVKALVIKA